MKVVNGLRRLLHNSDAAAQSLREAVAGIANLTDVENRKLQELTSVLAYQASRLDRKLERIAVQLAGQPGPAAGGETVVEESAAPSSAPAAQPPGESAAGVPPDRDAVVDIPCPRIDLNELANPIPAITGSAEFAAAVRLLADEFGDRDSLVDETGRALLHTLIRNQKALHAVEIGTFRGGTTEVMARAMLANGIGTLHTVGPFDAAAFLPVYRSWPRKLQQIVQYSAIDSMAFFMEMEAQAIRPDLVFIDGNHDYEFALFDLLCAARRLSPGGFIILDDSDQAGPYFAAEDFLRRQPDWIDCASLERRPRDRTKAFDPGRTHVAGTNFVILRSPAHYRLADDRPRTFGEIPWPGREAHGLRLSLDGRQGPGVVHLQCILRGFGGGPQTQLAEAGSMAIAPEMRAAEVRLAQPVVMTAPVGRCTIEAWLIWAGAGPLTLEAVPVPF